MSDRELDVMNIFWEKGCPLIASEIVSASDELSISTVQASLKKLIKRGYVQVADIVYSGKVLTRRYEAIKSPDAYIADEIEAVSKPVREKDTAFKMVSALLDEEQCGEDVLDELEKMLKEKKDALK